MVSVSSVHSLVILKSKSFVLHNFISIFVFGLLYYSLQYIDSQPFAINRPINNEQLHIFSSHPHTLQTQPNLQPFLHDSKHLQRHFSLMSCLYFSLNTQTTVGYGNMIPVSRACVFINSLQLIAILWITSLSINN